MRQACTENDAAMSSTVTSASARPATDITRSLVRSDLAVFLVALVEQRIGRQLHQTPEGALVRLEHRGDHLCRVAMRAAQRLGHDLVDDAEFEEILRREAR